MKGVFAVALACVLSTAVAGPLYDYVHTPDSHYSYYDTGYRYNNDTADPQWTGYLLNMTSQGWLDSSKIDHVVWTHQLVIIVPKVLKYTDTAGMYITGNSNHDTSPPSITSEDILLSSIMAQELGIITATLFQVPNAPIVFSSDPTHQGRGEDALVAYSWKMFLQDQSLPEWNVYLPMIKSAVRALDTIEAFAPKVAPAAKITKHLVHGASKRGWSTWLTAGVDDRVIGMGPIVMDMLNFTNGVKHMYQAYGGWTFAFKDYWECNITQDLVNEEYMAALSSIVDPLVYKANLTMPKLIIDSTGDEFFMPDDDWYWWGDLEGETYRLMVANAEHSFATGIFSLVPGLNAFYESILTKTARPNFTWTTDRTTGQITITSHTKPEKVIMRFATTTDGTRRDFRLVKGDTPADPCKFIPIKIFGTACLNPCFWQGEDLAPTSVSNGVYTYILNQPLPPTGWRAFLGELHFPAPNGKTFLMTTQVSIIPNTFPFPECTSAAQCKGVLV